MRPRETEAEWAERQRRQAETTRPDRIQQLRDDLAHLTEGSSTCPSTANG